ncbi:M23 family metallopeptidase [Halanaerobiaceae bacterium Z-7014]|uniref:M23 family metallopeptidase n=1 Tax=Halonatronomonas betaini TaxID=2778430 RepID=A0A931AS91_9FIRM|nr:M23 family metallopeptidase [Halonatronomonas betaini]
MNRKETFLNLKKISNLALVILLLVTIMEIVINLPQDLVNITRLITVTAFVFITLSLPWVINAKIIFKSLSVIGISLYVFDLVFLDFSLLAGSAIILGGITLFISDSWNNTKKEEEENETLPLKYYLSTILIYLNPFQLLQMIWHTIQNTRLSEPESFQQQGEYTLPFEEEWIVINGGVEQKDSHSWEVINQRYAYDFVVVDSKNRSYKNNGDNLEDYYCYGKNVLSPADGEVIKVKDGIRDYPNPGNMMLDFLAKDFRGNFVMIKHNDQEYSFMAHFIPGSFKVKEGDIVKRGQIIGKCGNSGHSTEPHLHFHFQDHPNFYLGRGIPIKFKDLKIDGEAKSESYIKKEERVAPLEEFKVKSI